VIPADLISAGKVKKHLSSRQMALDLLLDEESRYLRRTPGRLLLSTTKAVVNRPSRCGPPLPPMPSSAKGQDLVLDVLTVNRRAQALYQRLGLTEVARHGDHDTKITMRSTRHRT
jgi:ribosomal protein S18 acetylase RimI-like enzyme